MLCPRGDLSVLTVLARIVSVLTLFPSEDLQSSLSFLQKTHYWSRGPTLSLQALRPSLSSCSFAARDCGSAGQTWASARTLLLAVLGCVRVRGQLEALICFAGFRGMCLTSLSSGDSPTCPTMPS